MRFAPLSLSSSLRPFPRSLLLPALLLLAACRGSEWSAADTSGSEPRLPEPNAGLLPVVNPARAVGWAEDAAPIPAEGLAVQAFARGLQHPRWLYVLPNGDVLVAESNAQPGQAASNRLLSWAMDRVKALMGAATPSADRITLLRDADGDGHAERREVFLSGLRSPFGMALVGDSLYVANTDALLRFPYTPGATRLESAGEQVLTLPAVPFNYHWTKNVVASPDGSRLYLTVGSNSNIAENGLEREAGRALVLEFDPVSGRTEVYASGLRNPNGLAWEPETGALWTVVNERDGLGHDLPPDYLTALQRGGFYGWPWSYWGSIVDERVQPQRPERVAEALVPDYALGAHTAPLGLAFAQGTALPQSFRNGAFIALHGSWNRRPASGYELIFVPFRDGRPAGPPRTVLSGFLNADGRAQGRPVGVVLDAHGAVLLADDVGDTVWRVTAAP